jgi:hypothetical protein
LDTVFNKYGWNDITPTSLLMNPSNEFIRALDSAELLKPTHRSCLDSTHFRYCDAIGELIWPMITTPVMIVLDFPAVIPILSPVVLAPVLVLSVVPAVVPKVLFPVV